MSETFIVKIQAQNRILIPKIILETAKLKRGDKVRIVIEKVKS